MNINNVILDIMKSIKDSVQEVSLHSGFGHCAYGSKLLNDKLLSSGIKSKILVGSVLKDTEIGTKAKQHVSILVSNLPDDDSIFGVIKKAFTKRGNKLPKNTGHAVVLVDDVIYDVTSEQFGLPNTYSLGSFIDTWETVKEADVVLNNNEDEFKTQQVIYGKSVALESYSTSAHNQVIINLIGKIKLQYPEFVDKSGLGYCANASMVLQEELKKINIEGKLLYGKYLKDNKEGNTAKAHFSNLIKHFPVENAFHGRVKSHFVKNGNKISDKGGHVALLVGDVLYDVTSAQFGLPISYGLDRFLDMWADVHVVDITMKPERTAWNQKVLYTYQTKEKDTVSMESIGTSMGFEEIQPDSVITDIIFKLKEKDNNYSANSGLGYCSEASVALKRELSKIGIDGKLIYGKRLSNNDNGNRAKEHVNNVIKNYVAGPGFYGKIKANYIKNGNKVSEETGHMVVLVKDFVYDVTSAQFGLPVVYEFSKFKDMWDLVQYVDSENTTNKAPDKHSVSVEGLIDITGNVDEQDRIDFNKWFSIQSKQVQANCKIVSSDELGQDYMLHIDKNTPVRFICAMPRSAAHTENNTTARITVAPTLLGCLFGYARYEYDFRYGLPAVSKEKDKYRGGYEICELPFKHCLQPNSKLVYDSEYTGEHWLVTYNKPTLHYTPIKIGKVFIYKMDYKSTGKSEPTTTYEMYVEVHKEDGIKLTPTTHLNKGFHKVVFTIVEDSVNVNKVDKENDLTVTEISSGEYNSVKQLSAAMLSMESNSIPKYLKW